jgi:hypothetical protein
MRERSVIGRGTTWAIFLAMSGAGLVSLIVSTSKGQVDAPKMSLSGLTVDQARTTSRALVVQLSEQVRLQRSQLRQTEESLVQAETLLRMLGGPLPGGRSPGGRSPFEDEDDIRGVTKPLSLPSRSLPQTKP